MATHSDQDRTNSSVTKELRQSGYSREDQYFYKLNRSLMDSGSEHGSKKRADLPESETETETETETEALAEPNPRPIVQSHAWRGTWNRPMLIDESTQHPFTIARMTNHNVRGSDRA